jgi:hypothetical protein
MSPPTDKFVLLKMKGAIIKTAIGIRRHVVTFPTIAYVVSSGEDFLRKRSG